VAGFEDVAGIKKNISSWFEKFRLNELEDLSGDVNRFSRVELTHAMSGLLSGIAKNEIW